MRIGVIGTGTIATAVVRGIADDGHQITVSQRNTANAHALAHEFGNVTIASNQQVLEQSDIVLLGLMAERAPEVLGALQFRSEHRVITFMAGLSLAETAPLVFPADMAAIVMPFPGVANGSSLVMMQGDAAFVERIFAPRNRVFVCANETEMKAQSERASGFVPRVKTG